MTGRPGYRTMEMIGGSSAMHLARTPCVPLFCTLFNRGASRRALDFQGRAAIISIVRWNLRPVIFGVDKLQRFRRVTSMGCTRVNWVPFVLLAFFSPVL